MGCQKEVFGVTKKGEQAYLYTFTNASGMQMKVSDFGAVLVSVIVKDKEGKEKDVVLGYDDVTGYEEDTLFLGAIVGRSANRIGGAAFALNGTEYKLSVNDNDNNLHSGPDFYSKRMWNTEEVTDDAITLSLFSPHLDQGYPGNVKVYVTYTLKDENEVEIAYKASPDMDTILNMTNHSYFNMDGHDSGNVLDQKVWIDADAFTEMDRQLIPTGNITPVEGTPLDFRTEKAIGDEILTDCEAIRCGQGYDHNFVLCGEGFREVASLKSEKSGIKMHVYTDCPGMQLYTGNFMAGEKGKKGASYPYRSAACFESQFFPDAIHHENFVSPICRKGEIYSTKTSYRFEVV
ncbi:galactose mutarotase [Faecalicatena contorta]|uniref:aldose epimerase family protein n=1 Tax=Faecalicatena contorta TaxID=39482 RepID=UPI001F319509|nr:aldose epimerase family protein [Faecalicatena contorta]MCF2679591.1 galactose mutarotase [Faecalicatena contorta]